MLVTFAAPHQTFFKDRELKSIVVPGVSGMFGILKKHIPIVSELKPGMIIVTNILLCFHLLFVGFPHYFLWTIIDECRQAL